MVPCMVWGTWATGNARLYPVYPPGTKRVWGPAMHGSLLLVEEDDAT
jgi:hypothetical protein